MANIIKHIVKATKKLNPARNKVHSQEGGFGVEFGLWFAALMTLALNGDHIATSSSVEDENMVSLYKVMPFYIFAEAFASHEMSLDISGSESYTDLAQYLVSENWVTSDSDIA